MSVCVMDDYVELGRADRLDISWPIENITDSAVAEVELEDSGVWWTLVIDSGYATGYFAGPDFVNPAPAHVVSGISHVKIKVTDGRITVERDGGFIRIV